jgi:hypothetical protein
VKEDWILIRSAKYGFENLCRSMLNIGKNTEFCLKNDENFHNFNDQSGDRNNIKLTNC